jgi:hypothetical protein
MHGAPVQLWVKIVLKLTPLCSLQGLGPSRTGPGGGRGDLGFELCPEKLPTKLLYCFMVSKRSNIL